MHAAKFPINKNNLFFQSWQITCPWRLWPSLVSTARSPTLKGLRSDKPSHKHDSNKYQSKEFCNLRLQIRSDQICDAGKQNIPGLIDVLIAI